MLRSLNIALMLLLIAVPGALAQTTQFADYDQAFRDLHQELGRRYTEFGMKGIDWEKVGQELIPQASDIHNDEQFGLLCMKLVARLKDSHAHLIDGLGKVPQAPLPTWDAGLACLVDDRGRPVVYSITPNGDAARSHIKIGMTVISVDGKPAEQAIEDYEKELSTYVGYSSQRMLRYDAVRCFLCKKNRGEIINLVLENIDGTQVGVRLHANASEQDPPHLPVPIEGIGDSDDVSWTHLDRGIGYIYVRRIRDELPESLDAALRDLGEMRGLIIDVRGNTGGGFDTQRAFRNFSPDDKEEPGRPRYSGPIAILINERCISAGEGWASWFVANHRARFFGVATAGASSRKEQIAAGNGLYQVIVPVKPYTGFLNRPIEVRGLEPDVAVGYSAKDLAAGKDTVLAAAIKYLNGLKPAATQHHLTVQN
ncbi:MAG TPA: S41 family peptidase [Tepidisphaeraceae bacterium]|jgi:C-terminal processing protease CtpA/Prc|nr:S41 family peptidase [Tepidisphaeraceae bacterium]